MSTSFLFSTAYFPPISWFALLLKSDNSYIEVCETYTKQTFRNRCHILGPNGIHILTVPITKPFGNRSKTAEVTVSENADWKRNHWKAIETAYNKSPFFLYYADQISEVLFKDQSLLFDVNRSLIALFFKILDINHSLEFTTCFEKEPVAFTDFRAIIHPKKNNFPSNLFPKYTQVFSSKFSFIPDLSIIDLLFNEGPVSREYLNEVASNFVKLD